MSELTRQEATEALSNGRLVYFADGNMAAFLRDQDTLGIPTYAWTEMDAPNKIRAIDAEPGKWHTLAGPTVWVRR
ncbi:MAG: hypothetical protein Q7T60_17150 [Sphingopyxis sp.]|nr:hypothetical protein [Sphingopyxis sp.]